MSNIIQGENYEKYFVFISIFTLKADTIGGLGILVETYIQEALTGS